MDIPDISPDMISAWISLARAQKRLLVGVETALKAAGFPPLTWYDVLLELDRARPDGLRPMELEERLLLPQYGMSRLLERMDKAGFIVREKAPEDGRGQLIRITDTGRETREHMWPVYASALEETLVSRITEEQARQLGDLLSRLE